MDNSRIPSLAPTASPTPNFEDGPIAQFSSVMLFLCITAIVGAVVQGIAPRSLLRAVPHPTLIMIIYMIFGVIIRFSITEAEINFSVQHYIDPLMIQTLFLPLLMVEELFHMNTRAFFMCIGQLVWLAAPGVIISTLLTALFPMYIMPSRPEFDFYLAMSFGSMLSSTDPIAIIICVNELAAPKRLAAVVGGESLLNDGVSIIIVELFLELHNTATAHLNANEIVLFIFNQLLFSVLLGIGIGLAAVLIIRVVRNDPNTLITLCVVIPLLTYVIAAYFMKSSGVLAIVPVGILLNEFGRGLMIEHVEQIERLYDQLSFIAKTWLYALSGYVMGEVIASKEITGVDWGSLFVLYFWINIARFIMVFLSFPLLKRLGYGFSLAECVLLSWGGLRGAVGLTLALTIRANPAVSSRQGSLVQFFMCGSILLMVVNGVSAPFVLRRLKLDTKPNPTLLEALYYKMSQRCVVSLENAGASQDRAKWMAFGINKAAVTLRQRKLSGRARRSSELDSMHVEVSRELEESFTLHPLTHIKVHYSLLVEQRRHLVLAQQHIFQQLFARGLLNRQAWYILDRGADHQLEKNRFQMDQFCLVLKRARRIVKISSVLTRGFYNSVYGKLLRFLMDLGEKDVTEYLVTEDGTPQTEPVRDVERASPIADATNHPHDGSGGGGDDQVLFGFRQHGSTEMEQDNDGSNSSENGWFANAMDISGQQPRTLGITFTAEGWVTNFLAASWGFLFAQHQSRHVVDEMFTIAPDLIAFEAERRALHEEITYGCRLPAQFINAVGTFAPELMERFKQMHALSEAKNQLYLCISELTNNGLIERHDLNKLITYAERTIKRIKRQKFELKHPIMVGDCGELLPINPNFFPFPSAEDSLKEAEQEQQQQREEREESRNAKELEIKNLKTQLQRNVSADRKRRPGGGKRRSHSFSDYDLRTHCITVPLHFPEQEVITQALEREPQVVDLSRFVESLRLDDTESKRY